MTERITDPENTRKACEMDGHPSTLCACHEADAAQDIAYLRNRVRDLEAALATETRNAAAYAHERDSLRAEVAELRRLHRS